MFDYKFKDKSTPPKEPRMRWKTKKKKREDMVEFARQEIQKGLIFQLPGGSSHMDVYFDRCVIRCKSKTKMEEKSREIPFTSIQRIIYIPCTGLKNGCFQLITREMPDVKRSYWYAYENNLVVIHPANQELAKMVATFIKNPHGCGFVSPERMNQLKKARKKDLYSQAGSKAGKPAAAENPAGD